MTETEVKRIVREVVREEVRHMAEQEVARALAERSNKIVDYIVAEELKLARIAQQFDHYLTVGGDVKPGKSVGKS